MNILNPTKGHYMCILLKGKVKILMTRFFPVQSLSMNFLLDDYLTEWRWKATGTR